MMKSRKAFGLAGLLVAMMLACNLPAAQNSIVNENTPENAGRTEKITSSPSSSGEMPPAIVTDVFSIDGRTITATITTTSQPSLTASLVTITSTEDTNCRKGPGVMYEIVGKLLVGQTSDVVAKYQNGKFWLIKNPSNPAQECWVWNETTKVTGNVASLPEATPPATPNVTLNLTIYAVISPITYTGGCPVTVELVGNFSVNTPVIVSYQWYIGDLLVSSGAVTAGAAGTFTSSDQITITMTTTDPIRLKASAGAKNITTSPIGFSIICN
jgi:uncharacterized protein YgiM (DUF1202 family)